MRQPKNLVRGLGQETHGQSLKSADQAILFLIVGNGWIESRRRLDDRAESS